MFEIAVYEARRRLRGSAVLSGAVVALVALYVWLFPSVAGSGVDFDEYVEAFPPAVRELFGIRSLGTIEGFLAAELYAFVWVMLLALYVAYAAATLVADDVETGRLDLLLALPVSRARLLLESASALLVPLVAVNVVTPIAVYAGIVLIDEQIPVADLVAVHALSIPYLLACAGIGLVASVAFDRAGIAQRVAAGLVFALFLIESVVIGTELEPLSRLAPSHYYDPTAILVDGEYDPLGALVLLVMTAVLVAVAVIWFRRTDVA